MNRLKWSLFLISLGLLSHPIAYAEIKGVDADQWIAMNECPKELVKEFWYHISTLDNIGKFETGIDGPYLCFKDIKVDQYRIGFIAEKRVNDECTSTWFMHSDFDWKNERYELGSWSFGATQQKQSCPTMRDYRMR